MEETPTNFKPSNPTRRGLRAWMFLLCSVVLIQLFAGQTDAQSQRSRGPWQTLSGDTPLVIARGGFSGLFPDSSLVAYSFAVQTSVSGAALWCDVQLTKDGAGICFPDLKLNNASTIDFVYPNRNKSYLVNGVPTQGWLTIEFSLRELSNVTLMRGILSRSEKFNGMYPILTVEDVTTQIQPESFWLSVQHDAFYAQQNLGWTVKTREGTSEFTKPCRFVGSALIAEGLALREALSGCRDLGLRRIRCESDSAQLIKALNSREAHPELYGILSDVFSISSFFEFISFTWIPRGLNKAADKLAKQCLVGEEVFMTDT